MPRSKTVEVHADVTPFQKTLDELSMLAKVSQSSLEVVQRFFDSVSQVELIKFEQKTAARTGHFLIVIKPSDKLLELVATLRACESETLTSDTE